MLQTDEKTDKEAISGEEPEITKDMEEMFRAGVHFGYSRSRRHPQMEPYIFGIRNNIEVFDLEKVQAKLEEAAAFVRRLAEEKKTIIFVGTKPSVREAVEKTARELNMPYAAERWLGGLITNFTALRKRMDYFEGLKHDKLSGAFDKYTKKERLDKEKEIAKLERHFGGLIPLKRIPDALMVIDADEERIAVQEAAVKKIPVIAVAGSDNNPRGTAFMIPANDSSASSVAYILSRMAAAYEEGLALAARKSDDKK